MLRITKSETATEVRLVLEGKLIGLWVVELQTLWEKIRAQNQAQKCVIDLSGTTAIDENGQRILTSMCSEGVRFIASGVATIHLIKEIKCKCARQLAGGMLKRG